MRYLTAIIALVLLSVVGCSSDTPTGAGNSGPGKEGSTGTAGSSTTTENGLRTVSINASGGEEVEVRVEIADEPAEQAQGLMNRTSLGEDRGMLFVFEDEATRAFWMKNTLIPLSIAYIDSEGRIVDIQKMEPEGADRTVSDAQLQRYVSAKPARYALEVNQGFFEERGVSVGDTAQLPV